VSLLSFRGEKRRAGGAAADGSETPLPPSASKARSSLLFLSLFGTPGGRPFFSRFAVATATATTTAAGAGAIGGKDAAPTCSAAAWIGWCEICVVCYVVV
jgi:hypothetical protein